MQRGELREVLRSFCDTFEMVQKVRIGATNRLHAIKKNLDENERTRLIVIDHIKDIQKFENTVVKKAKEILEEIPVYTEFLSKINGIGERVSLRLLSLPLDINKELSDWNAYFGLVPVYYACKCEHGHKILLPSDPRISGATCIMPRKIDEEVDILEEEGDFVRKAIMSKCGSKIVSVEPMEPKRKSGYFHFWNAYAKKVCYIVTDYWVKNKEKSFYGLTLKKARERLLERQDGENKYYKIKDNQKVPTARATLSARRTAFKLFLAHFYQASRELAGMDYRMPYVFEYLKHNQFVDWKKVVELEEQLNRKTHNVSK